MHTQYQQDMFSQAYGDSLCLFSIGEKGFEVLYCKLVMASFTATKVEQAEAPPWKWDRKGMKKIKSSWPHADCPLSWSHFLIKYN